MSYVISTVCMYIYNKQFKNKNRYIICMFLFAVYDNNNIGTFKLYIQAYTLKL